MSEAATHVSLLTPAGRGAVSTVAVSGPQARELVNRQFHAAAGRALESFPPGRIVFGRWGSAAGEELVVCCTSAIEVEVHCHGGRAAAAEVVRSLVELGAHELPWPEWIVPRAGGIITAETQIALAEARTERAAAILLDQYRGALEREVRAIVALVQRNEVGAALGAVDHLLARAPLGLHLTTPWRVVIAGRPNVGKSSLLNALVGYERAIVYDHPGTTRDVLRVLTACAGWPVEFADTAGLGAASDPVEQASMARAELEIGQADLALHVVDATQPELASVAHFASDRLLTVLNKSDLLARVPAPRPDAVFVSALARLGLADLLDAIATRLVHAAPPPGAGVPFHQRHVARLLELRTALERGNGEAATRAADALLAGEESPRQHASDRRRMPGLRRL